MAINAANLPPLKYQVLAIPSSGAQFKVGDQVTWKQILAKLHSGKTHPKLYPGTQRDSMLLAGHEFLLLRPSPAQIAATVANAKPA